MFCPKPALHTLPPFVPSAGEAAGEANTEEVRTAHDSDFKACCMVEPAHRNAAAGSAAALKKVAIPASLPKVQFAQLTVQTR